MEAKRRIQINFFPKKHVSSKYLLRPFVHICLSFYIQFPGRRRERGGRDRRRGKAMDHVHCLSHPACVAVHVLVFPS